MYFFFFFFNRVALVLIESDALVFFFLCLRHILIFVRRLLARSLLFVWFCLFCLLLLVISSSQAGDLGPRRPLRRQRRHQTRARRGGRERAGPGRGIQLWRLPADGDGGLGAPGRAWIMWAGEICISPRNFRGIVLLHAVGDE